MEPRRRTLSPGFSAFRGPAIPPAGALSLRLVGALLLAVGVITIWATRLSSPTNVYLSEMGAPDAPTPLLFNSALLVIAFGGGLVALGRSGIRARVRVLGAWSITATLLFACASIALASRVTCTPGCPVPFTDGSTVNDLVHTSAATLGFAAVGLAIIQAAWAHSLRSLFALSVGCGALILFASATGGLFSVFRFHVDLGGWFELTAATAALLWVILFALVPLSAPSRAVAPPATS
ncbi:hypothetical protein C5B96_14675 [Subtercola sp. Z020]|uniref:DUF998 domain-containing protein n=1 Tax=Subtercola sp. Z020 TaxID=2080582 RepID=UPI000CE76A50|nr:DUF998 domain-containing protein [Subtercola sp. Z020]PPF78314.1 hypothetical protein C5B96_14675 [Subtercola sp. Z020]